MCSHTHTHTPQEEPFLRSNVILKTNASTGQTSGNIVNAVWEQPSSSPAPASSPAHEDVDFPRRGTTIGAAKTAGSHSGVLNSYKKQTSVGGLFGSLSMTSSGWLKKMSTRYVWTRGEREYQGRCGHMREVRSYEGGVVI